MTESPSLRGGVELPRDFVTETPFFDAYERLRDDAFVRLTAREATSLANAPWHCPAPRLTILVRGVLFDRGTGGFGVEQFPGGVLRVFHESLGDYTPPLTEQPILVCVAELPTEVCVTAGIAE